MLFTDNKTQRSFAKDPAVVKINGRYLFYYTTPPAGEGMVGYGIGIAASKDMESWENISYLEPEGEVEKNGICAAGAMSPRAQTKAQTQSTATPPRGGPQRE